MIDLMIRCFSLQVLLSFLILCYSCTDRVKSNTDTLGMKISKCLSEKGKVLKDDLILINVFSDMESNLLQKNMLSDKSKLSYQKLFEKINSGQIKDLDFSEVPNIEYLSYPSLYTNTLSCTWYIIEKDSLDKLEMFKDYYKNLKKINQTGDVSNWVLNNNLLESTPGEGFDNIAYRYPLLLIIYQNLSVDNLPR